MFYYIMKYFIDPRQLELERLKAITFSGQDFMSKLKMKH